MKQAFVSEKYGTLTLSVIRDANPRMQITVDVGLPTMPIFSIELPFPETEAHNANRIFNSGVDLLEEQIHLFLNEQGFVEDDILDTLGSLRESLKDYTAEPPAEWEEDGPLDMREIRFGLTIGFWQQIQDHVIADKQAAVYVNRAQEFEDRLKQRTQDQKAKEDAKAVIDRFKQNIQKNSPGQLFVTLLDRNGKPAGVARVTNQGLTKFADEEKTAATWKHYVIGEYWLNADTGHSVECAFGDYTHESFALESILVSKWDDIKYEMEEELSHLSGMKAEQVSQQTGFEIEEIEEEWKEIKRIKEPSDSQLALDFEHTALWSILPDAKKNEIFNGDYKLFQEDVRQFFMKYYNEIRVINNNFEAWTVTKKTLNRIVEFIYELSQDDVDENAEVIVEEVPSKRWVSTSFKTLEETKNPGELWRMQGHRFSSKKKSAIPKVSFVVHCPGHKDSKGETAEWCVKSHETGKILSSHKTKEEAKKHLQQMHIFSADYKSALFNRDTFNFGPTQNSNKPLPRHMYLFDPEETPARFIEAPRVRLQAPKEASEAYDVDSGPGTVRHLVVNLESKFGNWEISIEVKPDSEWMFADVLLDTLDNPMRAKGKNSWDLERELKARIEWHYILLKKDLHKEIKEGFKPTYSFHELELDGARLIQEMIAEIETRLGPEPPKHKYKWTDRL